MREEYNIEELNPRKNPYVGQTKKHVTMNMKSSTIDYFKQMSEETGVPYQTLMNMYLDDCVRQKRKLKFV